MTTPSSSGPNKLNAGEDDDDDDADVGSDAVADADADVAEPDPPAAADELDEPPHAQSASMSAKAQMSATETDMLSTVRFIIRRILL